MKASASQGALNLPLSMVTLGLSIGNNLVLSLLIVGRIMWSHLRTREALAKQHLKPYSSTIAIIGESSAIYSVVGIAFLVTAAIGNSSEQIAVAFLAPASAISIFLIVLRVNLGTSISESTFDYTSIVFHSRNRSSVHGQRQPLTPLDIDLELNVLRESSEEAKRESDSEYVIRIK